MAYTTVFDGVIFVEGSVLGAHPIGPVKADLSFKIGGQLKNLDDVKKDLANKVKASGGNCLLEFKYGQKHKILSLDSVAFWGEGLCCLLQEDQYRELYGKVTG